MIGFIACNILGREIFCRSIRQKIINSIREIHYDDHLGANGGSFEQMMQMLTGFWVRQITGAVASHSIADHLAKGPASAEQEI